MKTIGIFFLLILGQTIKASDQSSLTRIEEKLATSDELQMDQLILGDYDSDVKPNKKRTKLEKRSKKLINKKIKAIQKIQSEKKNNNKK